MGTFVIWKLPFLFLSFFFKSLYN